MVAWNREPKKPKKPMQPTIRRKKTLVSWVALVPLVSFHELHQFLVVMHEQLRVDLTNELENHTDDDDETGTRDDEILA